MIENIEQEITHLTREIALHREKSKSDDGKKN